MNEISYLNTIPAPENVVYGPVMAAGQYPFCLRQFEVQGVNFTYGSTWLGDRWSNPKLDDGSGTLMRLTELESEVTALRALVGELVEGLAGVVPLIEHHDFSNGVEHNGMDQGDVFARNILGEVQALIAKAKEQVK